MTDAPVPRPALPAPARLNAARMNAGHGLPPVDALRDPAAPLRAPHLTPGCLATRGLSGRAAAPSPASAQEE